MAFDPYFSHIYKERWLPLFESLKQPEKQICFSPFSEPFSLFLKTPQDRIYLNPEQAALRSPEGHLVNYILDPASLGPVWALDLHSGDHVLDLCAAPGGKSLAILSHLGSEGSLLSNDSSQSRFSRLKKVLFQYSPPHVHSQIHLSQKDGTRFGFHYKNQFSKILVDVPCSGERHLISSEFQNWTLKRSRFLSVKQYTLLCAALLCASPGARIVYSTCSLNPVENDGVIERFLKKKGKHVRLCQLHVDFLGAEPTQWGWQILPDKLGYGPIYFSALEVV